MTSCENLKEVLRIKEQRYSVDRHKIKLDLGSTLFIKAPSYYCIRLNSYLKVCGGFPTKKMKFGIPMISVW